MRRVWPRWIVPCAALLVLPACLPDDPIDEDDTAPWDDDDSEPPEPEDCPTWAPEFKIGYHREFDFHYEEPDRTATYTGLHEWEGGVYWQDEVADVDTGAVTYWVYDHCVDGDLYRVGMEQVDGTVMLFNPPALQFEAGATEGSVWETEYNLYLRHINERYEVVGMETIEVPAGTFEALHVKMRLYYMENDQPIEIFWDTWYVDGLGLVKQESTTPTYFEMTAYEMPAEWR